MAFVAEALLALAGTHSVCGAVHSRCRWRLQFHSDPGKPVAEHTTTRFQNPGARTHVPPASRERHRQGEEVLHLPQPETVPATQLQSASPSHV